MSAETIRLGEKAWYKRIAGIHVLKVSGTDYEMGYQHGVLLRESIPRGPLPYYRDYVGKILRQAGAGGAAPAVWWLLKNTVGRRVQSALPSFAKEAVRGLADGAELPLSEVMEGCVMPDSLVWTASRIMQLSGSQSTVRHRVALELGCSSAIAWGDATADGKLLHARNLDYHGVGQWSREAAVLFHEPKDGMKYVSVAAAGVLMGGVTAMNEAGLTLTVHQHMFSSGSKLGGTPIGVVGDLVMKYARSLEDAERILGEHKPIGCWTYLVTDGRRREVLCHEQNPARQVNLRARPSQSTFAYANIYLDPELASTEVDLYGSYWRANVGRYERLRERMREGHGRLDPNQMASILADEGGEGCRIRRSIGMLLTVASVVFRPEDGVVWVATGEAPTSQNAFEAFDLRREDHAPEHGPLTGGVPSDRGSHEAFIAYRDAYLAYFDQRDPENSRRLIGRAVQLQPREPLYRVLDGLLALQGGAAAEAERALGEAISLGHPDVERRATFHLWRARARDVLGRRDDALVDYRAALDVPRADPPVRKAAQKGLRRAFTARDARRYAIDFAYADVVSP
jgi:tetratricopeptide (TPR) repeat protein